MSADDTLYEPVYPSVQDQKVQQNKAFREAIRRIKHSLLRKKGLVPSP